jgi:predicted RNase H-like HicB family nuclease
MKLCIEVDREQDGRWIADIPELPGVMVYGASELEALDKVKALALHVIADRIEAGEFESLDALAFIRPNQAA